MSTNENRKTTIFAATGAVMLALAAVTWLLTQPPKTTGFEKVGQEFFQNFTSSSQAASLEVSAIDPDSATLKQFRVQQDDGLWTIPSHYGYPAEASDRLATTSSSLIGLTRESLVGRLQSDHERFGVVDPLSDDLVDPDSAGKRITLKDADDEVLVDLIVGKQAEESQPDEVDLALGRSTGTPDYYVRRPDETQTYKVNLGLDLSTRFSDWIRPDLLDLDSSQLRQLTVDNYELEEEADPLGRVATLYKKQGDQMQFTRDTGFGPWNMAGLDEERQQLDSSIIDAAVQTLDDLRIVGVRPKTDYQGQPLLNADLTLNRIPELEQNVQLFRQIMGQLQMELSDYGFNLAPAAPGSQELVLVSKLGELSAGTEQGVVYNLQFGNPVRGDEQAIEIGDPGKDEAESSTEASDESEDQPETEEKVGEDSTEEDVQNRYLMIRVAFDESLLGDRPEKPEPPVEPTKPEGYVPPPEPDNAASGPEDRENSADSPGDSSDNETDETDTDDTAADDRPAAFREYDTAVQEYEDQKTEYELKLSQYEDDIKEYEDKVEAGRKRVEELNERFGRWFYVISADNLDALRLQKDDLVSAREQPPGVEPSISQGLPDRPNIDFDVPVTEDGNVPNPDTETDDEGTPSSESETERDDSSRE